MTVSAREGRLISGIGGRYQVRFPSGETVFCPARGVFRHAGITPVVGDRVLIRLDGESPEAAMITEILPRDNVLIRPPVANVSLMVVLTAVRDPEPSLLLLDEILSVLENASIPSAIAVTKADLDRVRAEKLKTKYQKCGYPVYVTSDRGDSEESQLHDEALRVLKAGGTVALCGVSGVGKSSLCNRLFPGLDLETGELSRRIARGRHTTRAVSLYPFESGYLTDTPGFSSLDFEHFDFFDLAELPSSFREFEPLLGNCRYKKCTHTREEGCAILSAVAEKRIPRSRHDSYLTLYGILKKKPVWEKNER
ncbi:MAG: ribosome small subunit-dependent GTPase A [Clostridia bacterium]|nr:ribosome small subunit-dependent GTPase A [Clostridia bacterium]